jgi:hypothetical protein
MDTKAQAAAGYYIWEVPGKPVVVHLHLDVVDRLAREVLRGFGALPKRGAEVGGILLGTIEHGDPNIVRVEDFETVPCGHERGPSFLLGADDQAAFEDACRRWQPDQSCPDYAVGLFRGHTREGLALAPDDVSLLDRHFPAPGHIAMLVKPFATKASLAGFFFREDGKFQETTPLEFPLRRRELAGDEVPADVPPAPVPSRSAPAPDVEPERYRRGSDLKGGDFKSIVPPAVAEGLEDALGVRPPASEPEYAGAGVVKSRWRGGWVWLPLSFIFLLLGVLLGFQAALSLNPRASNGGAAEFPLSLSVTRSDDNLTVRWNRESAPVRGAQKAVLEIEDGGFSKPVELDAAHLLGGSIIYRNSSNTVRFRLIVYLNPRLTVTETLDWRQ